MPAQGIAHTHLPTLGMSPLIILSPKDQPMLGTLAQLAPPWDTFLGTFLMWPPAVLGPSKKPAYRITPPAVVSTPPVPVLWAKHANQIPSSKWRHRCPPSSLPCDALPGPSAHAVLGFWETPVDLQESPLSP